MTSSRLLLVPALAALWFLLPGCAVLDDIKARQARAREDRAHAELRAQAAAEHTAFQAKPGWKGDTYRNEPLLKHATSENIRVEIGLNEQRGLLLVHGAIAMDFPVSSGRKSHPTPTGSYTILGKKKDYRSNLYGKIHDPEGVVVIEDADSRTHEVPEGGSFVGSSMPYWMRLTNSGVGLHVGYVPGGRGASHGCIRLRRKTAAYLFDLVEIGTPVVIAAKVPALDEPPVKAR